jgi:thiol-disulfide isomerase/thioredoxin
MQLRTILTLALIATPVAAAPSLESLRQYAADLFHTTQFTPGNGQKIPAVERAGAVRLTPVAHEVGTPAYNFNLGDVAYDEEKKLYPRVLLSSQRGNVVLLDFWATWCTPCLRKLPTVEGWAAKYKGKGLVVYAVNTWTSWDDLKAFRQRRHIKITVLFDGKNGGVAAKYGVTAVPHMVLIDHLGNVIKDKTVREADIELALKNLPKGDRKAPPY